MAATVKREKDLRKRLGIPDDAQKVLVFSESSHWDPNWLFTSAEYYRLRARRVLDAAVRECEAEPRRVFGVECVFFLKMYWERRPKRQDAVRALVNAGRFRLTGSGMTTPDTCIPVAEAIIRDYLIGQEWLRKNGMTQEPRLAYLPDNFGVVPTLPTILSALGFTQTAVSRIDGAFYPGTDYAPARLFPRPGSSAELLQNEHKTNDFIWRAPDKSAVICHWNPFTYGQGDTLFASAPMRMMGVTFGLPARSLKKVAKKIDTYVAELSPLARTPYMLCPIGMDFNGPLPALVAKLDAYNREVYPHSGIFVTNAGMDDYLDLVSCHTDLLPELTIDFNPYWTGFYSARPEVKHRCRKLVDGLLAVEAGLALSDKEREATRLLAELSPAWETAAVANHHDFITGTSPDRVFKKEQRPWLIAAQDTVDRVAEEAAAISPPPAAPDTSPVPPSFSAFKGEFTIDTPHYRIKLSGRAGGCIVSWVDGETGEELVDGPFWDAVVYHDSGGLWRMGHEFAGGRFKPVGRMSDRPAGHSIEAGDGWLCVTSHSTLARRPIAREIWFRSDSPFIRMRLTGSARRWKTITCRFSSVLRPERISMDVQGGVVGRPLVKIYDPTFWAAVRFAHIVDPSSGRGLALFMGGPAAVSASAAGVLECVALRNAPMERAWHVVPIPTAFPAYGTDFGEHSFDLAAGFTRRGDWKENGLHLIARDILKNPSGEVQTPSLADTAAAGIRLSSPDVRVLAIKRADRGKGLIVRLQTFGPDRVDISLPGRTIARAFLADARERDIERLVIRSGAARVPLESGIVTVRLLTRGKGKKS